MRFMKKLILIILSFLLSPLYSPVYAVDSPPVGLNLKSQPGGLLVGKSDPGTLLGLIIKNTIVILFTVGAIGFTFMILWGAVGWILSGGDKEKIAGARKRITTALVGLVLLSLTFVIMLVVGQILGLKPLSESDRPRA